MITIINDEMLYPDDEGYNTMAKQEKITAILIDVENQTITEVETLPTFAEFYKLMKCDIIEYPISVGTGNILAVDEEGLFKANQKFFDIAGGTQPYAGNALIVGTTRNGNEKSTNLTVEYVKKIIHFY